METASIKKPRSSRKICTQFLKWCPVLFLVAMLLWFYHIYVIRLCFYSLEYNLKRVLYLVPYHVLFFMLLWTYYKTIFTKPACVPDKFKLPDGNEDDVAKDLAIRNYTSQGALRYCMKCRHIKPDRAHHCRQCAKCVLKMDHHCPWANNCISFTNHKAFILLLFYGIVFWLFISVTTLDYFIAYCKSIHSLSDEFRLEEESSFPMLFLFLSATIFTITGSCLFLYHMFLVFKNRTTIEASRPPIFIDGPNQNGYNLGKLRNFLCVFGSDYKHWFIPNFSSYGDGIIFPVKPKPIGV